MDVNNPYQTPASPVTDTIAEETYTPNVFALSGRIGRLRYLAYYTAGIFSIMPIAVLAAVFSKNSAQTFGMVLFAMSMAAMGVYLLALGKRRLNDLDRSGWFLLLSLVPFVNALFGLYLVFAPGTDGRNNFGPAPARNGNFVLVGALLLPILLVFGALSGPSLKKEQPVEADGLPAAAQDAPVPEETTPVAEPAVAEPAQLAPAMAEPAMAAPVEAAPAYSSDYGASESGAPSEDSGSYNAGSDNEER